MCGKHVIGGQGVVGSGHLRHHPPKAVRQTLSDYGGVWKQEERSFADMLVGSMRGSRDTDRQGDAWLDAGVDSHVLFADNASRA